MKYVTCLSLLAVALFLTACLEEESYLSEVGPPDEVLLSGTGIPQAAGFRTLTLTDSKKNTQTYDISHIDLKFNNCGENIEWCNALVNDCGINNSLRYNYREDESGTKSLSFANLPPSSEMRTFAGDEATFAFSRANAQIELSCDDCPIEYDGEQFTGRHITMRAWR